MSTSTRGAMALRTENERLTSEIALLRSALLLARDGLLLAMVIDDEYDWPDGSPDYHALGYARTQEIGMTGDFVSYRTEKGDLLVEAAIDATAEVARRIEAVKTCPKCRGTGQEPDPNPDDADDRCGECDGRRVVPAPRADGCPAGGSTA